jgi:uncharacterized protein
MKFHPDRFGFAITGHGPGWIAVAGERIVHSVLLHSDGTRAIWPCERFDLLTAAHFEPLALARPEVALFGSGARLRFARPQWLRPLIEAGIGIECMDTAAACRTFNILAGEGRRVAAALLLEAESDST